ncbi:hypothetical protein AWI16_00715 [Enterobacter ludwigii]|nr:hypothetical protein AWI16_00715 [Enterobacter ludwigii]
MKKISGWNYEEKMTGKSMNNFYTQKRHLIQSGTFSQQQCTNYHMESLSYSSLRMQKMTIQLTEICQWLS